MTPSHSALLSGPPGVGKTLASRWVAEQVDLPLVSLDLAAVLSSYLGTSGRNIRDVLDFAKSTPCVLLLDEFDALAKARDDDSDVGELKRIVNVLLVELDRWESRSFLIAATNHAQLLDPAIGRRFDRIINFPLPGLRERELLIADKATGAVDTAIILAIAEITEGSSPSDLTRLIERAGRRSILYEAPFERVLLTELISASPASGKKRDVIWERLHREFGLSLRAIADLAGVSHPTVSQAIRRIEK
ncbi:AAA family ATPase [Arthrobacter sp. 18067]|uniref:AAA family ATPase n=1 Tax=Arthrobacter sp. 18067 TaxID=2681413 RepID=UPI001F1E9B58|nr:AAA family ATPase [Arthrobacter sp. 18067]